MARTAPRTAAKGRAAGRERPVRGAERRQHSQRPRQRIEITADRSRKTTAKKKPVEHRGRGFAKQFQRRGRGRPQHWPPAHKIGKTSRSETPTPDTHPTGKHESRPSKKAGRLKREPPKAFQMLTGLKPALRVASQHPPRDTPRKRGTPRLATPARSPPSRTQADAKNPRRVGGWTATERKHRPDKRNRCKRGRLSDAPARAKRMDKPC